MIQRSILTTLVIDDRTEDWVIFRQYLQQDSLYTYHILEFETATQAIAWCEQGRPDVILLNFMLPDGNGLELLGELRKIGHNSQSAIILLTEQEDVEIAVHAMKSGAQDYLVKDHLAPEILQAAIHDAVEQRHQNWLLEQSREQKQLIAAIALRIRQSLKLKEVLAVTAKEVRQFLHTDRVVVYQFNSDMSGTVVSESVLPGWTVSLGQQITDTCFQEGAGAEYRQGKTRAINNIYEAGLTDCHVKLLEQFEVKANLVVPILVRNRLWGLLIAHQCSAPRQWDAVELELLEQLAVQIAIAIQQASTYEIAQTHLRERKRVEKTLRESEKRFRATFEQAAMGISHVSLSGQFLLVNQRFADITGYPQPELMTLTFQEITHPEDLAADLAQLQMLLAGAMNTYSMDKRYIRKDGTSIWIKLTVSLVRDAVHNPQYFISVIEDISERKQAEVALQASEARFQAFMNHSPSASWITDADGRMIYISQTYLEAFQLTAKTVEEVIGKTVFYLYPVAIAQQFLDNIRLVAKTQKVLETVEKAPRIDGTLGDFLVYKFPLQETLGQCVIGGVAVDITERIRAQLALQKLNQELEARVEQRTAALRESEQQLRYLSDRLILALQAGAIGTWDWDMVHDPEWDDRIYELYGIQRSEISPTYQNWQNAIHPDDVADVKAVLEAAIRGEKDYDTEFRVVHPDGSLHFIRTSAIIQRDVQGKAQRMVGINYDITERKLAENKLQKTNEQLAVANAELARASRLKDEFLATMSHELRTPLNAILGISEAMQEGIIGVINEEQKRGLQTIERSGNHLLALINDILDLSKIEAGHLELNYTPIAILELCYSSVMFIKQQADQKAIQLEVKIPPQLPQLLLDERRIRQVLINILNNAVKFTPKGGRITLEVTRQKLTPEGEMRLQQDFIRIAVIDTGIGIAPEFLKKLFQPFVQIDSSLNRQYQGTGLGLSLVKKLVEMHGGKVGISSELGVGSCFTVDLPCGTILEFSPESMNQVLPELNSLASENIKHSPLILLAEDNEANIFTISSYLEKKGYQIILAKNRQEMFAQSQLQVPNLILIDIQMSGLDALQAIKQMRLDQNCVNIPIIALADSDMSMNQEKCLASGANEYLRKPVQLKQLAVTIQKLLTTKDMKK
jgi:PAS domain S-box-containing protein